MNRKVHVSFLPSQVDASRLPGSSAVMIDVLRASTTICTALEAGADRIIPAGTIDDARRIADQLTPTNATRPLLGGERRGVKIDGFDLGNSPAEYTPDAVKGRTIVFTTTNGTRALLAAIGAEKIYVGGMANFTPLVEQLERVTGDIHLICAGTDGQVTLEDVYCAGLIADDLSLGVAPFQFGNDEAAIAVGMVRSKDDALACLEDFRFSRGGRNLVTLGLDSDIVFAARTDTSSIVPVYRDGEIIAEPTPQNGVDEDWAI